MGKKCVLNTEQVKVFDTGTEYQVLVVCQDGAVIEHEPFTRDQHGLVGAILLGADICAGKFFPRRVMTGVSFAVPEIGFDPGSGDRTVFGVVGGKQMGDGYHNCVRCGAALGELAVPGLCTSCRQGAIKETS